MATTRVRPGRTATPRPGPVVRTWRLVWQVAAGAVIAVGGWLELRHVDVWLTAMAIGMLWALSATIAWLLRPEFEQAALWVERFAPLVAITSLVLRPPAARSRCDGRPRGGAGRHVAVPLETGAPTQALEAPAADHLRPPTAEAAPLPAEDLDVPDVLGPKELAQAWQSSFVALQRASSPTSRARIADVRAACLDALERCDQKAFTAWLDQGPRPGSDPSPWFVREDEAR